ncbi:hypothetical protein MSAN_01561300 [Mycena sanguinolenta]|uniref:Protein kish n=1 Tax=Mycena sanguinolenta TaxID=230812 RepID=A0A8H7CXS9_9AGAR|nr:hypothetical protein MSAN_01561300 [Mycena sanguinolenta]
MSALFNFQSLLLVILLLICTCTYVRALFPSLIDRNKTGFLGIFFHVCASWRATIALCITRVPCDGSNYIDTMNAAHMDGSRHITVSSGNHLYLHWTDRFDIRSMARETSVRRV